MALQNIGRYEVKAELGGGRMVTVYLAYDPRFERDVVIKVMTPEFLHDPTFRVRFRPIPDVRDTRPDLPRWVQVAIKKGIRLFKKGNLLEITWLTRSW